MRYTLQDLIETFFYFLIKQSCKLFVIIITLCLSAVSSLLSAHRLLPWCVLALAYSYAGDGRSGHVIWKEWGEEN